MKKSTKYAKILEWSEEDQCIVVRCPGLFYGGYHGDDEQNVCLTVPIKGTLYAV